VWQANPGWVARTRSCSVDFMPHEHILNVAPAKLASPIAVGSHETKLRPSLVGSLCGEMPGISGSLLREPAR